MCEWVWCLCYRNAATRLPNCSCCGECGQWSGRPRVCFWTNVCQGGFNICEALECVQCVGWPFFVWYWSVHGRIEDFAVCTQKGANSLYNCYGRDSSSCEQGVFCDECVLISIVCQILNGKSDIYKHRTQKGGSYLIWKGKSLAHSFVQRLWQGWMKRGPRSFDKCFRIKLHGSMPRRMGWCRHYELIRTIQVSFKEWMKWMNGLEWMKELEWMNEWMNEFLVVVLGAHSDGASALYYVQGENHSFIHSFIFFIRWRVKHLHNWIVSSFWSRDDTTQFIGSNEWWCISLEPF